MRGALEVHSCFTKRARLGLPLYTGWPTLMRIEIHEPKPFAETLRHTLLRVGLGLWTGVHGFVRGLDGAPVLQVAEPAFWQEHAMELTLWWGTAEFLVGLGLLLGLMTRFCAVGAAALALCAIAVIPWPPGAELWQGVVHYEGPALRLWVAFFLASAGGGDFSLDFALRERARRKAIQDDNIWLQPPYVSREDGQGHYS